MRRRPLAFAALTRRATRRATYARHVQDVELPPLAMLTTIVGAVTLSLTLCGAATVIW